jgi:hypothetical protein
MALGLYKRSVFVDELLKTLPSIVQAVSILVTSIFAIISLRAWRRQLIGKRRFEVAEEVILAAHRAQGALEWIRNGFSFSTEAEDRPKPSGETENEARLRDSYYVPLKRLRDSAETFIGLSKAYLLCKVHFGSEAAKAIDEILRIQNNIAIDAKMLLDDVGNDDGVSKELRKEMRESIWGGLNPKNPVTNRLNDAVNKIDEICARYLT